MIARRVDVETRDSVAANHHHEVPLPAKKVSISPIGKAPRRSVHILRPVIAGPVLRGPNSVSLRLKSVPLAAPIPLSDPHAER